MRNISSSIVNAALSSVRKVEARIKIKDDRLVFSEYGLGYSADDNTLGKILSPLEGWIWHKATAPDHGILRAALKDDQAGGALVFQWMADPTIQWPTWTTTTFTANRCQPGMFNKRIWAYRRSDGRLHLIDVNTATGAYTITSTGLGLIANAFHAFAPISDSECYWFSVVGDDDTKLYEVHIHRITVDGSGHLADRKSDLRILYTKTLDKSSFHAVRLNGMEYIYASLDEGQRAICITASQDGNFVGEAIDIAPLDYADDTARFSVGGAIVIDNKIMVSGSLIRAAASIPMQIYAIGPDHYTAGRDMFIGSYGAVDFTRLYGGNVVQFRDGKGSLVVSGDYLYHILPGSVVRAKLPTWLGGTSSQWSYSCNNVKPTNDRSGSATLTLDVPSNIDPAIKSGMTLDLELYVSSPSSAGRWFTYGVYEIDTIQTKKQSGTVKSIIARPRGIKRLTQWKADASYDYWSQAFRSSVPSDMRYNMRVAGIETYSDDYIRATNCNQPGAIWSTEFPGHSYASRCTIDITNTTANMSCVYSGPAVCVYTETADQAAARLGIEVKALQTGHVQTSGVALIYARSSDAGFTNGLYLGIFRATTAPFAGLFELEDPLKSSTWNFYQIGEYAVDLDPDEYDLMVLYVNGRLEAYYKLTAATTWIKVISIPFSTLDFLRPCNRDDLRGRGGLLTGFDYKSTAVVGGGNNSISVNNFASLEGGLTNRLYISPPLSDGRNYLKLRGATMAASMNKNTSNRVRNNVDNTLRTMDHLMICPWQPTKDMFISGSDPMKWPYYAGYWKWLSAFNANKGAGWIWAMMPASWDLYPESLPWPPPYPLPDVQRVDSPYLFRGCLLQLMDGNNPELYEIEWYDANPPVFPLVYHGQYGIHDERADAPWRISEDTGLLMTRPAYSRPLNNGYVASKCWPSYYLPADPSAQAPERWVHRHLLSPAHTASLNGTDISPFQMPQDDHDFYVGHSAFDYPDELKMVRFYLQRPYMRGTPVKDLPFWGTGTYPGLVYGDRTTIELDQTACAAAVYGDKVDPFGFMKARILPGIMLDDSETNPYQYIRNYVSLSEFTAAVPDVIKDFVVGSGNPDMSFAWIAKEICRKAGVLDVAIANDISSFTHAAAGWDINADIAATQKLRSGAGLVKFKCDGTQMGVYISSGNLGEAWTGTIATISGSNIDLSSVIGTSMTLVERLPIAINLVGSWVTMSFNTDKISVWVNDALIGVFRNTVKIGKMALVAAAPVTAEIEWSSLDLRVDNFAMDIGASGLDALRRLIKRKRIHFLDNGTGGIKLSSTFDEVNTELTPYTLTVTSAEVDKDSDRITRVRMEGVDVREIVNEAQLAEHGNFFSIENFEELEERAQFGTEGNLLLDDIDRSSRERTYRGAADPRVEPWDKIWVDDGSGVAKQVLVTAVSLGMSISEDSAEFDMELNAEEI
jgi:hypothetical protein